MGIRKPLAWAAFALAALTAAPSANAQDCMTGELRMFAGAYAPAGYAMADGSLLPINQYQALFSVLGVYYGGDGRTTFALPDLRGRVPIGAGMGPGLNNVNLGQKSGDEWTVPRQGQAAAGSGAGVAAPVQISNMQPSTGLNFIICVYGIYPSR